MENSFLITMTAEKREKFPSQNPIKLHTPGFSKNGKNSA